MSTLKCATDVGCHSPRPNSDGRFEKTRTKPYKVAPVRGQLFLLRRIICALRETKQKQNIVGPSIRELRMRKGWSQASLSLRLKMAGWNCSRSRLAKIESGLIIVRDRDLPYFLNVFQTSIEALYPAQVFKR